MGVILKSVKLCDAVIQKNTAMWLFAGNSLSTHAHRNGHRYSERAHLSLPNFNQNLDKSTNFSKLPCNTLNENLLNSSQGVTYNQTDTVKLIETFL